MTYPTTLELVTAARESFIQSAKSMQVRASLKVVDSIFDGKALSMPYAQRGAKSEEMAIWTVKSINKDHQFVFSYHWKGSRLDASYAFYVTGRALLQPQSDEQAAMFIDEWTTMGGEFRQIAHAIRDKLTLTASMPAKLVSV